MKRTLTILKVLIIVFNLISVGFSIYALATDGSFIWTMIFIWIAIILVIVVLVLSKNEAIKKEEEKKE